jgi:hypothetical protein
MNEHKIPESRIKTKYNKLFEYLEGCVPKVVHKIPNDVFCSSWKLHGDLYERIQKTLRGLEVRSYEICQ